MRYTDLHRSPGRGARAADDGLLFPVPGATADAVAPRAARRHEHPAALVRARSRSAPDDSPCRSCAPTTIRARVYVTDSRLAVACTKYDTGGGWIGGPIALTLNVAQQGAGRAAPARQDARRPRPLSVAARRLRAQGAQVARLGAPAARRRGRRRDAASRPRAPARRGRDGGRRRRHPPRARGFASTTTRTRPTTSARSSRRSQRWTPLRWTRATSSPAATCRRRGRPRRAARCSACPRRRPARRRRHRSRPSSGASAVAAPPEPDEVTVVLRRPAGAPTDDLDITLRGPPAPADEHAARARPAVGPAIAGKNARRDPFR